MRGSQTSSVCSLTHPWVIPQLLGSLPGVQGLGHGGAVPHPSCGWNSFGLSSFLYFILGRAPVGRFSVLLLRSSQFRRVLWISAAFSSHKENCSPSLNTAVLFSELGFDAHFYLSFELCHWVESLAVGEHQRMFWVVLQVTFKHKNSFEVYTLLEENAWLVVVSSHPNYRNWLWPLMKFQTKVMWSLLQREFHTQSGQPGDKD